MPFHVALDGRGVPRQQKEKEDLADGIGAAPARRFRLEVSLHDKFGEPSLGVAIQGV